MLERIRRFFRFESSPSAADPRQALTELFQRTADAAARHDWDDAIALAREAGALAERINEPYLLHEAARALQRLQVFDRAWELYRRYCRILWINGKPEWDGRDLSGRTLLIRPGEHHIGELIRFARLIGQASQCSGAARCIALTEDKLVGLMQRNFPGVTFAIEQRQPADTLPAADAVATFETLCTYFANDWAAIASTFVPLKSDPALTRELWQRYHDGGGRPVIGVSWWSSNGQKDLPSKEHWLSLMQRVPATFVSLQYGDAAADIGEFQAALGDRFIVDATIDPTGDRDRFAAQVAALDGVVTIPQTCAHFSGALNIPTIVILDDRFHLSWPQMSDRTPWYPETRLSRRRGRPWSLVMEDVAQSCQMYQSNDRPTV
jgi:hypothetical protein